MLRLLSALVGLDHSKLWYHLWYQCLKLGPLNRLPLVEVPWSDGADWDPALLTAEAAVLKMAGELNMLVVVVVVVLLQRLDCWVGSHWCLQSNQLKIKSTCHSGLGHEFIAK